MSIIIVEGGQWGSEAKGAITGYLCKSRKIDIAVRTGAINAGHTVYYQDKAYAMQQIPCGWVNPLTKLVIGAGGYIHPATLEREIEWINKAMPGRQVRDRLYIDMRCGTHTEEAEANSKAANRHHSIGATGKGCSEAIVAKIRNRNAGYELFSETKLAKQIGGLKFIDTVDMLNEAADTSERVLIEGTQGSLLDLHLGPYPFTTSRMTSAANWVAECGLAPGLEYETVLVVRTYPIRVAGNSGPMPREIEWINLARVINRKLMEAGMPPLVGEFALTEFEFHLNEAAAEAVSDGKYQVPKAAGNYLVEMSTWDANFRSQFRVAASELHRDALLRCSGRVVTELRNLFEMTTVTKKLRRIAKLDIETLQYSVMVNRPVWVALTFVDYEFPETRGWTSDFLDKYNGDPRVHSAIDRVLAYADWLDGEIGVPIRTLSFGPKEENVISYATLEDLS